MEKKVSHLLDAEDFIREADNYQLIRSCRAAYNAINELQDRVNGSSTPWFVCNSAEVGEKVAAVAYVFARRVFEQTNIPIGIMQSYRGGTELETWMSQEKLTTDPGLRKVAGRKASQDPSSTANYQSIHFNGQINPLIGFPIKGFLWYQGESNIKRALEYRFMMKKLIEDYRTLWNMGDLPFYYVQMFNILAASEFEEGNWTDIREQQAFLLLDNVKNIGMAVGIDTNEDPTNKDDAVRMHPKNKTPIGERMARIALKNTYGFNDMLAEGPSISRYKVSNDTIYLYFKNYGTGLKIKDGEATLKGFAISGADKSFKIATATITNDSTVAVKSSLVPNPVAARYAWARNPICNLYNSENIPASTSRTDIWPSKVTYENFTSTFNADEDADLMAIKINGTPLGEFNPQQLEYTITVDGNFLDVTAIKNSPFSKLEITKNAAGDEVTLTVTAENLSQKVYKVKLHSSTGKKDIVADSFPINIFQEGKLMVLENKSENNYSVRIYNATGLCLIADSLNQNAQKGYALAAGAYIVYLNSASESKCVKFLLKS